MNKEWPTIEVSEVFHIGTLDQKRKGTTHNTYSLEGNGLSVSVCPDAWRSIAKLGASPTWLLRSKVEGADQFLDVHELNEQQWNMITDWAESNGYVKPCQVYVNSWYDDELDSEVISYSDATKPGALEEAIMELEDQGLDEADLKTQTIFKATPKMNERVGFNVDLMLAKDIAMTFYAQDVLHPILNIQGVWWNDELDVSAYSAPRGVIFKDLASQWSAEQVEESHTHRTRKKHQP